MSFVRVKKLTWDLFRPFSTAALCALALLNGGQSLAAQSPALWTPIEETSIQSSGERALVPIAYRTMRLNQSVLLGMLAQAPMEFTEAARTAAPIITLPMPDGSLARFKFEESPIMEKALADQYPEFKTYRAQGIDDPTATARFDYLPSGFHAMIRSVEGTVMIDPYAEGNLTDYTTYWKRDAALTKKAFTCGVGGNVEPLAAPGPAFKSVVTPEVISGTKLRTYRLAVAATNEYAVAVGSNTVAGTLAAQVLIMNRVNGVYERELAIRMVIIGTNNQIVYAGNRLCGGVACTAANDPYTNDDGGVMLGENQTNIDSVIGSSNYDIGHVFSTGGGGVATLNSPCNAATKARGVTGLNVPVGDPFAIDYVAHEMGHQWGANHTFNTTAGSCSGNRATSSAYEPGSGVTIMAYAGICGAQNLARNSIDTFHVKSLEVMKAYSQDGGGNACAAQTDTFNTPPTVTGPGNFTIPKGTPFALTATASDVNNDSITYDWQEYDLGAATTAVPNTDAGGAMPVFRPYLPTVSGTRTFPSLQYILNNANVPPATFSCSAGTCLTGELLPSISRAMTFQVIARDNRANGGGINTATSVVTVDGVSGPFAVTAPNTAVSVAGGSSLTVSWNVNGTSGAPVNAANVKISLSTDGGATFPNTLISSTPNDGSQAVTVPSIPTTTARIKVEAVGNIFFDISDANFTITGSAVAGALDVDASNTNTRYGAATDGILVLRYMLGVRGANLTANALGGTATRTDPAAIKTYLDGIVASLDIDGDNTVNALTDGLLILRYMLNITSGPALLAGAANPAGSRTIAGTIPAHLASLMPP